VQLRAPGAPLLRAAPARAAARTVAAPRAEYTSSLRPYTIRKGDTLESIAKKRGLSIKELQQYNKDLTTKGARQCYWAVEGPRPRERHARALAARALTRRGARRPHRAGEDHPAADVQAVGGARPLRGAANPREKRPSAHLPPAPQRAPAACPRAPAA
jgi:hypothetical protein